MSDPNTCPLLDRFLTERRIAMREVVIIHRRVSLNETPLQADVDRLNELVDKLMGRAR